MPDLQATFGAIDVYLFDQLLRGRVAPSATVLDAGCGAGRNLVYFLRAGHRVLGADADPAAVAEVRRLAAELAPAAAAPPADAFRVEPVEAMTFPDGVADLVVSSAVLHFARDPAHFDAMLRGTWRVVRPGGILFCRLAGCAGLDGLLHPLGHGRYALPDGTERFLADERMLRAATDALGGELLDPIKTTVVHGRRAMMTWVLRRSAAALLAAGALSAAAPHLPGARPLAAQPAAPRVSVDGGTLEGTADSATGVLLFRGVPYAAPPVGPLRFRPPAPPAAWSGVRSAAALGHNCLQGQPFGDIDPYPAGVSEDCLYLNVATASTSGAPRPVMVWIHGGGFYAGFGGEERHNPTRLAQKGAVVVTLNYRLGPFGFLAHPALAAESPHRSAGNYGILDQIAALEWVRRNVARFGGDPAQVTIFGESAGGFSVGALVASPLARGLFQRAILESGTGIGAGVVPRDTALARGARFTAERLGVAADAPDAAARLRALPADSILHASRGGASPAPSVNTDGWVLPRSVDSALATGQANLVPAIVGSNRDEPAVVFGAPARAFARLLTARGVPVYLYQFTRAGDDSAARARGAYHSAEITFVFGRPHPILASAGRTAYDSTLADVMSSYWVAFAATGDPNGPLPNVPANRGAPPRPRWPRYDPRTDASLELGPTVVARERVRAAEYDSLDAAGRARGEVRP